MSAKHLLDREWVINKDSGLLFLVHPLLTPSSILVSYTPTEAEILAGCKLTGTAASAPPAAIKLDEVGRADKIKAAILAILPENYVAPAGGRPAMPKVGDIKTATGFKDVTAAEIVAVMATIVATEPAAEEE